MVRYAIDVLAAMERHESDSGVVDRLLADFRDDCTRLAGWRWGVQAIDITVLKPSRGLQGFADTWRQLEAGSAMAPRLAFGGLRELFSAITEKRLELLRFVAGHDGLNVRRLASELGRDYKNVHTDVAELVELGLLGRDVDGHLAAPFDEIVIHAGIRSLALS